jgi:hypothetical protein
LKYARQKLRRTKAGYFLLRAFAGTSALLIPLHEFDLVIPITIGGGLAFALVTE